MPMYEYRCHSCGETFELRQSFNDEPLTKHDKCGGDVERLISAPALQFKGSGWYITDYARGNGGAKSKDSGDSAKGDTAKKENKTTDSGSSSSTSSSTTSDKK